MTPRLDDWKCDPLVSPPSTPRFLTMSTPSSWSSSSSGPSTPPSELSAEFYPSSEGYELWNTGLPEGKAATTLPSFPDELGYPSMPPIKVLDAPLDAGTPDEWVKRDPRCVAASSALFDVALLVVD